MNFRQTAISRRKQPPTINVTPLIDVVFILLIFFLLTTTFRNTAGLDVELPSASSAETQQTAEQAILTLNNNGELFLSDQKVTQTIAIQNLKKQSMTHKNFLIILQADQQVPHGDVVKVLDGLRNSGLKKVAIGTHPSKTP